LLLFICANIMEQILVLCQWHNSEWHWDRRIQGGRCFWQTINKILYIWHTSCLLCIMPRS